MKQGGKRGWCCLLYFSLPLLLLPSLYFNPFQPDIHLIIIITIIINLVIDSFRAFASTY